MAPLRKETMWSRRITVTHEQYDALRFKYPHEHYTRSIQKGLSASYRRTRFMFGESYYIRSWNSWHWPMSEQLRPNENIPKRIITRNAETMRQLLMFNFHQHHLEYNKEESEYWKCE